MRENPKFMEQLIDVWEALGHPHDARYSWDLQKNDNQIKNGKVSCAKKVCRYIQKF